MFAKAWVDGVSLRKLGTWSPRSLLSEKALRDLARRVVRDTTTAQGDPTKVQHQRIDLSMALTNLAGLTYKIGGLGRDEPITGRTFLDLITYRLQGTETETDYQRMVEGALASGANALGFPPVQLRRLDELRRYKREGLEGFPTDGYFWYTDGGTIDNEPLGRMIDLVTRIDQERRVDYRSDDWGRLAILVHPDPAVATPDSQFQGHTPQPPFIRAGLKALSISRSQSIYEDLRRLQKINSRIAWIDRFSDRLSSSIESALADDTVDAGAARAIRERITEGLRDELDELRGEERALNAKLSRSHRDDERHAHEDSVTASPEVVRRLARAASGLEDRRPMTVEVISPLVDKSVSLPPAELLAGRFLGHFGGFLKLKFRQSDFNLGFSDMKYWIDHHLKEFLSVDLAPAQAAVAAAQERIPFRHVVKKSSSFDRLGPGQILQLGQVAAHASEIVVYDTVTGGL